MSARLLVVLLVAPLALCIAGLAIIDPRYHAGLAPVPFLLVAYTLGVAVWGAMRIVVSEALAFKAAIVVLAICALCTATKTNPRVALWALGAPAIGGIAVTIPLRSPAERTEDG